MTGSYIEPVRPANKMFCYDAPINIVSGSISGCIKEELQRLQKVDAITAIK